MNPEVTGPLAEIDRLVQFAAAGIELLAVAIITISIAVATVLYLYHMFVPTPARERYEHYKGQLGRALLLGLEVLVAADIVRTIILDPTLGSVAFLAVLVAVRTFLSWALIVEIEGRWPWQPERERPI